MVALLFAAKRAQKAAGGKPNTLSVEGQLLMMLACWRHQAAFARIPLSSPMPFTVVAEFLSR